MLIAAIRPVETQAVEVTAPGLPEIYARLEEIRPEGFDLMKAPAAMDKGSVELTAHAVFVRRDGVREISAASMTELRGQVPEGWQMLHVRRA